MSRRLERMRKVETALWDWLKVDPGERDPLWVHVIEAQVHIGKAVALMTEREGPTKKREVGSSEVKGKLTPMELEERRAQTQ